MINCHFGNGGCMLLLVMVKMEWCYCCCWFMKQVLQLRQGTASGGLTIKELNDLLDQLSSSENRCARFSP